MNLNLFYYFLVLIREGHEAQYQNMNGTGKRPCTWFSLPQIVFIIVSGVFVSFNKEGLSHDIIDYILSALSIMTALFMSLIIIVLDKLKSMEFKDSNGKSNITHLHSWHFIKQFASITSYATLIAVMLIFILICTLLFGHEVDLHTYSFVDWGSITFKSILLFLCLSFICFVRFLFCYFLLDFLLMTLFAVSLIFQSIFTDLQSVKPADITVNKEESVKDTIRKEFGKLSYWCWLVMGVVIFIACIGYVWITGTDPEVNPLVEHNKEIIHALQVLIIK